MGKITIFTSNELNSKIVSNALESREIPYTEISLDEYPSKLPDIHALTGSMAVPKVFFNTRHVAGVDQILKEFQRWDHSTKYKTPLEKYQAEIYPLHDPSKAVFDVPSHKETQKPAVTLEHRNEPKIQLTETFAVSYSEIMEQLKFSVPIQSIQKQGKFFKNVFTGEDLALHMMKSVSVAREKSNQICKKLLEMEVIHSVHGSSKVDSFNDSRDEIYRLQCFMTPDILNSYHSLPKRSSQGALQLVSHLSSIMNEIHKDCVDDSGLLDVTKCVVHRHFPMFEFSVCELQTVSIFNLSNAEKLAFSLNVYKLMLAYAFIKIGIPSNEGERIHFLSHVKFVIDGCFFTLADWVDGILRANKKGINMKAPFGNDDRRLAMSLEHLDLRIHFALNVGSFVGSHVSVPFCEYTSENFDEELKTTSFVFFEDRENLMIDLNKNEIHVTNGLGMYKTDFGKGNTEFLTNLREFMKGTERTQVRSLLSNSKGFKLVFKERNWGLFAKNYKRYDKDSLKSDITGLKALVRRFRPPKEAPREEERLDALRKLKILDTAPEDRFDRITRKVQEELAVPLVLVSLVEANRQWFKSKQWVCKTVQAPDGTGRDISFCGHAILQNEIMIINDALTDERFADNPLVQGDLKLRFYAGVPLSVPGADGTMYNIGTLCVIDFRPRNLSEEEVDFLKEQANLVKNELLRRPPSQQSKTAAAVYY